MLSVSIPPEILNAIINELPYDTEVFKTCCLVSHLFLALSQPRLFSTVDIIAPWVARQHCRRFHEILKENPKIASYVRHLNLRQFGRPTHEEHSDDLDDSGDREDEDNEEPTQPSHDQWMADEETLPPVLRMLDCLQSIALVSHGGPLNWSTFTHELEITLLDSFMSPKLTSLTFHSISNIPIHLFVCFSNLKDLVLTSVDINGDELSDIDITRLKRKPTISGQLESLRFSQSAMAVKLLIMILGQRNSFLGISSLRCLRIYSDELSEIDIRMALCVMQAAAATIESFSLSPYLQNSYYSQVPVPCSLKVFSDLKSLRDLRFGIPFHPYPSFDHFPWLANILGSVSPTNIIENITVFIGFNVEYRADGAQYICNGSGWAMLDEVLTRPLYSSLKQVTLVVSFKDLLSCLQDSLPLLRDKGILKIQEGSDREIIDRWREEGSITALPF